LGGIRRICGVEVSFDRAKEKDLSTLRLLPSLFENKVGGIGAHKPIARRLWRPPAALATHTRLSSTGGKEVKMSDIDEKLIVKLGQRISEQNEILRMIAASLEGVEAHLREIAISSNPAPNFQRPLSEYPTFDWPSNGSYE
jgi:hypothetical protein